MNEERKPFGVRLKQPGQRKHEAPSVSLGYPADGWDGELTFVHPDDTEDDQWSVFLPHHCDEWMIATGTREHALKEARRFRDELDIAIGLLAGEILPDKAPEGCGELVQAMKEPDRDLRPQRGPRLGRLHRP